MKATQELPENYQFTGQFDLNENRGLAMILNLVGLGVLFGIGALFMESLVWLRPAYLSSENILIITGLREFWRGVLLLVISLVLVIVLREGLHGLVLWTVTGQLPKLGMSGAFKYAAAPEWYLPRRTYLWTVFTPLIVITLLGITAVPLVPLNFVPGVMLVVAMNVALAVSDVATLIWLLGKSQDILILDYGDGVKVFTQELGD